MIKQGKIIFIFIALLYSCEKEPNWDKHHITANINEEEWSLFFSQPSYKLSRDTTWTFSLLMQDKSMRYREHISIQNFSTLIEYDTIFLSHVLPGEGLNKIPTAFFYIKDYDARLKTYDLLEDEKFPNWIVFTDVRKKNATGHFQLAFKVPENRVPFVPNQYQPDTIFITEGHFNAIKLD